LAGRSAGSDEISPSRYTFPSEWLLLDANPTLWSEPGHGSPSGRLNAPAGDTLVGEAGAVGDGRSFFWIRIRHGEQRGWLPEALLAPRPRPVHPETMEEIGREPVDRFRGIAPAYAPHDLVTINYGYESDRTYLLRREAARACEAMIRSARADGLNIRIVSAYRAYDVQRRIYLNKLKRSGWRQKTVAKPGHSEHQLGTTVDFTGADDSALLRESFQDTPEGRWLREHAPGFGFALSYTSLNQARTGYAPEPWHYRYYGPELAPHRHAAALGGASP
jgi:LAS superfamily LD-carboxypeptidase LdcB